MSYYAIACIWVALTANAIGDALKFKYGMRFDKLWHVCKWLITFPLLVVYGILSHDVIVEFLKSDWWHYSVEFYHWLIGSIATLLIWGFIYRYVKKNW